ncbi:hypothetical protein [uncultured Sphingomonas sp.]|uniref:hypothetical protein n=1 Tax=uncultured Sphingomonas sp. TaxID=158754 RepID=UPI0025D987BF|nr:hypothetical protein [uncultured Sphingomonas sp.]
MNRSLLLSATALSLLLVGCGDKNKLDNTLGLPVVRSTCPAVAVAAYTGDISVFSPPQSQDARALDVMASITNLRTTCDETGNVVHATATFDVEARRASHFGTREVVLPYFATVLRGGSRIMSKQQGRVLVRFAEGQTRATATATAAADVQKSLAALPSIVQERLRRKRKATDADASIDPLADPKVKAAINEANFELVVGFQLTEGQLAYNATR